MPRERVSSEKTARTGAKSGAKKTAGRTDLGGLAALQKSGGNQAVVRLLGSETTRDIARQGISGAGRPLTHRPTLQKKLGAYDIGGVESHVGKAARDATTVLGATGYAMGESVAFRRPPSLSDEAHEVAHVLGQRVSFMPSGAQGRRGDRFERFAHDFTDRVASGKPVEPFLDRHLGRGAARPKPHRIDTPPVQFQIGPGMHGAIVVGHAYFFEAEAVGADHYRLRYVFRDELPPIEVAATDEAYDVVKTPEEAKGWLRAREAHIASPKEDISGTPPRSKPGRSVESPTLGDETGTDVDEIPISSGLVSMYDGVGSTKKEHDGSVLSRRSLKAKGGSRSALSKARSRASGTLSQTKYTELLDALDAYGNATTDSEVHEALGHIIGHAQHWLATHPRSSQVQGDSKTHTAKFDAVEAVRDAARAEFMHLAGISVTEDPELRSAEERMMFLLDDVLRDPLFASIYDAVHHGTLDSFKRWFTKTRNYVKLIPIVSIFKVIQEGQQANKRKERSRAIEEQGRLRQMRLVEHMGSALAEHYKDERKKRRTTGVVSAVTTPLSAFFPVSGMVGMGASGLTDVGGQALSKTIDKPIEKLSTFVSEKTMLKGHDELHKYKGGDSLMRKFAIEVSRFTVDTEVVRSLILYLGLGPREEASPQERSRLELRRLMGCGDGVDLLEEELTEGDTELKDTLSGRQKGKKGGTKGMGYSSVVGDGDDVDWLRALWVSEGYLGDTGRRKKGRAKKHLRTETTVSSDDDGRGLLTGLKTTKTEPKKSLRQTLTGWMSRSKGRSGGTTGPRSTSKSVFALSDYELGLEGEDDR